MSDGTGCKCAASGEFECGCDGVDWRSAREVELESENKRLREVLEEILHSNKSRSWNIAKQALGANRLDRIVEIVRKS